MHTGQICLQPRAAFLFCQFVDAFEEMRHRHFVIFGIGFVLAGKSLPLFCQHPLQGIDPFQCAHNQRKLIRCGLHVGARLFARGILHR